MRIDPNLAVVPVTKDANDSKAKASGTAPPSQSAVVTLSAGATASAQAAPVDITGRLARIRTLLEQGNYPVDLDKLAASIVEDDHARTGAHS